MVLIALDFNQDNGISEGLVAVATCRIGPEGNQSPTPVAEPTTPHSCDYEHTFIHKDTDVLVHYDYYKTISVA